MAADQIVFSANSRRINERSAYTVTARFRNQASAADVTPTNVQYRIDSVNDGGVILDWTSATPGTTVSIAITSAQNAMRDCTRETERRQLVVAADKGLSTQFLAAFEYDVRNLVGVLT